jgi:endonuclease/exonuclease/phosphatase family metal-dependent hydrolase
MFMKRILVLLICLSPVMVVSSQSLIILTYNIRYDNPADGQNSWTMRKAWLCNQIRKVNPDVFGIQEGLAHQVDYIDSSLAGFSHIGVGREDGATKGEFSAIFYNASKFKLLKQSSFWLSQTPEKPSPGWDAACIRICTFGLFKDIQTGHKLWVFNTHFDHVGIAARRNSAMLILRKIDELNRKHFPVILMGDFNGDPGSEPIRHLMAQLVDTHNFDSNSGNDTLGTFNGFDADLQAKERIDFIFTEKKGLTVTNCKILREFHEGHYLSDHFPVVAEMRFEELKKP